MSHTHDDPRPTPHLLRFEQIDAIGLTREEASWLIHAATDTEFETWHRAGHRNRKHASLTKTHRRELPPVELQHARETHLPLVDKHGRPRPTACKIGDADDGGLIPLTLFVPHPRHPNHLTCAHLVWLAPQGVTLLGLFPEIGSPVTPMTTHGAPTGFSLHFIRIISGTTGRTARRTLWPWAAA